jgi:FtsH-binding integral membrane protein
MRESISIWWFAGLLLLAYGIVILTTGLWELVHPLANPPVLNRLHAPIWWGAILAVIGLCYVLRFRRRESAPAKSSKN